jgi:two-component system LytT family sensor kinase
MLAVSSHMGSPDQTELLGQLVGYGFSVTLALLVATLAWQHPGSGRGARMLFAICAAAWALGGLTRHGLLAAGIDAGSALDVWVECLIFSAASVWPISLSLLWNADVNLSERERAAASWLMRIAVATAVLLIGAFLFYSFDASRRLADVNLPILVAYNAAVILTAGSLLMYRHLTSVKERVMIALIPLGPVLTVAMHNLNEADLVPTRWVATVEVLTMQSIILTILGGLFYLGRFRGVDRLAKLSLRIVLAWALAVLAAWLVAGPLTQLAMRSVAPIAVGVAIASACIAIGLFAFVQLGRASDHWVDRRVFGRTDPASALMGLREQLSHQETVASVLSSAERFLEQTLNVNARVVPRDAQAAAAVGDRTASPYPPDSRAELFPVPVGEAEPFALLLQPGERRLLVTGELDLVRQTTLLIGRRLEALERERDRLERSRREAGLVHQLVEAELRALRAQINPHFLFNSLNTIASLTHDDPALAERMTLKLARIFRHVLTHTDRQYSSLKEEMEFLRAYLDIEQIRFGARLKVDFRVADAVVDTQVPSLILQPLVENAIKHGLSPKIGECRLVISGAQVGEHIMLSVEDDGVGARPTGAANAAPSTGIGLRNVRERLRTLYGERARLLFESQAHHGSRAAIYVPLGAHP